MENIQEESQISLIDLLLVIVENLKLLVLGPVLLGFMALGVGYLMPKSYTSNAILSLPTPAPNTAPSPTPAQAAAIMVSPVVLDPVIRSANGELENSIEEQRLNLAKQIKATVGKDMLLRLEVAGETPAQAQALANAIIDGWLNTTVPGERDRADLETRLGYAKTALDSVTRLIEKITNEGTTNLGKPLTRGEAGTSLMAVGELQSKYLTEVLSIPRALQGLSRDVIVQQPTLPIKAAAPKKALIAVIATLATGFALLLFVFVRHAVRQSANDAANASKWAQLNGSFRRAWGRSTG